MTIRILFFLAVAIACAGCSDSTNTTASSNGGATLTGDLVGTVALLDYRGRPVANKGGISVQCDGTSYSAMSDSNGNWVIHNLPSRTYSITFSKSGCYSWRDDSFLFLGGGIVHYRYQPIGDNTVTIGEYPKFTITLDAIILPTRSYSDSAKAYVNKAGSIYAHTSSDTPDSISLGMFIICGTNPGLKAEDKSSYVSTFTTNFPGTYAAHDTSVNVSMGIAYNNPIVNNFSSGTTIYLRAYSIVHYPTLSQPNELTDKYETIGYGLTGSNVLSAVIE